MMGAFVDETSQVASTAKLFEGVRIVRSTVGQHCSLGDSSDVGQSVLEDYSSLNRRNLVRRSTVGCGSHIGMNSVTTFADIGNYCSISWNVSIGGRNHDYTCPSTFTSDWWKRTFGFEVDEWREDAQCRVGSDVWIGSGAIVLSGVTVGDGAVIGAGSVVTRDVAPYAVVVGSPAKQIKYRFDERTRARLLEAAWWDWPHDVIAAHAELLTVPVDERSLAAMESVARSLSETA